MQNWDFPPPHTPMMIFQKYFYEKLSIHRRDSLTKFYEFTSSQTVPGQRRGKGKLDLYASLFESLRKGRFDN